jgi:ornithine cyclodeaminase/alanine dehydrogenase-like protein (mu-crystallin family)
MALFLREDEVGRLLQIDDVIAAVETAFREHGEGRAVNRPRQRTVTERTVLHVMSGGVPAAGVMGVKSYSSARGGTRFLAQLYSTESGELLAVMEANRLGQMRTGAASAVATRHLARPEAGSIGLLGTGWQARTQLRAVSRVRPIALVKCYSRTPARREAFADEMVQELGMEVVAVPSAHEAVEDVDVIITITTAREPVLLGEWVRPGVHINAAGGNVARGRRELDADAVRRSTVIAVDDLEQAKIECGDLIEAEAAGVPVWDRAAELGAILTGRSPGRTATGDVTLFESQGIAIEDVVTMKLVYERARSAGIGMPFPGTMEA